jgi:hypothetical protein
MEKRNNERKHEKETPSKVKKKMAKACTYSIFFLSPSGSSFLVAGDIFLITPHYRQGKAVSYRDLGGGVKV